MPNAESMIARARPYSERLATVGLLVAVISGFVYLAEPLSALRAPFVLGLCLALIYSVDLAAALYRTGTGRLPIVPFVIGAAFVTGGVVLDGVATLSVTPTLEDEGNPVARVLLAAGLPVSLIIIVGVTTEILFAALVCILWASFLRHRSVLIASAWHRSPATLTGFIEAAIGVGHLSYRQILWPHTTSDLPSAYHVIWFMTAGLVGGHAFRWYLGLACLDCIAWPLNVALIVSIGPPLAAYYCWLGLEYVRHPIVNAPAEGAGDDHSRHPAVP